MRASARGRGRFSVRRHNEALAAGVDDARRLEARLEDDLVPILEEAADVAARNFERLALDHTALTAAVDVRATSTMIALRPAPGQAETLADPDGYPPEELHVTLVYLGEVDGPLDRIQEALHTVAASHAPLEGVVGGYGQFGMPDGSRVGILLPDVPGLVELRVAVTEALVARGFGYARTHGYCPHITVDDSPEPGELEEGLAHAGDRLDFRSLWIVRGGEEAIELPLTGGRPLTAGARPRGDVWAGPLVVRTEYGQSRATSETGERIAEVAEKHRPDGGYGETAWNRSTEEVVWIPADWTSDDEIDAAISDFLDVDGVESVHVAEAESALGPYVDDPEWEIVWTSSSTRSDLTAAYQDGDRCRVCRFWFHRDGRVAGGVAPWRSYFPESLDPLREPNVVCPVCATTEPLVAAAVSLPGYCLAQELRGKTDPVRVEAVNAAMTPGLRAAGLSFDPVNPFAEKALSRAASQVVGISQTTQLDVMKVIGRAYDEGLTIPQTARAIRVAIKGSSRARATMIARTELAQAANGGSLAATRIVQEETGTTLYKQWLTAPGAPHPRHEDYEGLDGQTRTLDDPFDVGGEALMYPGDPDGVPEETINCFPAETLVVAPNARVGYRRRYRGGLIRVETDGEHRLAGTPNHPVLTSAGWKPLGELEEGDYLVCGRLRELESRAGLPPDVDHAPTAIEEVVSALARGAETSRIAGRPMDFHGDGMEAEVEVVASDRLLRDRPPFPLLEPATEDVLVGAGFGERSGASGRSCLDRLFPVTALADRGVGGLDEPSSSVRPGGSHPFVHRGGAAARLDLELDEAETDRGGRAAVELGESLLGDAVEVSLAQVVKVERESFHGDVFNLQTETGAYLAGGIIAHNCRCTLVYTEDASELSASADPLLRDLTRAMTRPADAMTSRSRVEVELRGIVERLAAGDGPANWTAPAPDEILQVHCEEPGASLTPPLPPHEPGPLPTPSTAEALPAWRSTIADVQGREFLTQSQAAMRAAETGNAAGFHPDLYPERSMTQGIVAPVHQADVEAVLRAGSAVDDEIAARAGADAAAARDEAARIAEAIPGAEKEQGDAWFEMSSALAKVDATRRRLVNARISGADLASYERDLEAASARLDAAIADYNAKRTTFLDLRFARNRRLGDAVTAEREALRSILSDVREMAGGKTGTTYSFASGGGGKAGGLVSRATELFPRSWVERQNAGIPLRARYSARARGHYGSGDLLIGGSERSVVPLDPAGFSTAIHELGHVAEENDPRIRTLEWAFYQWRVRGRSWDGPLEELRSMGGNYRRTERYRPDEFSNRYMGKSYGDGPTSMYEILTVGLEAIWTGSYDLDPEYRRFILGLLASL